MKMLNTVPKRTGGPLVCCTRSSFTRAVVVSSLLAVTALGQAGMVVAAETKPNILFFLADDLGWRELGCYGSKFYESPTLDRLATSGIRFTNAYTAATVCSPTRASIVTGQTPARHGCTNYGGSIDPTEHFTLANVLREGGYQTFFAGKWHIGNTTPAAEGFSVVAEESARGIDRANDPKSTRSITANTLAFLKQTNREKRFFAHVNYHAVHTLLRKCADLVAKYQAKLAAHPPKSHGPAGLEKERDRDNKQVQDDPAFAAMVEGLDRSIGTILDALAADGRDQNTIVIFYPTLLEAAGLPLRPAEHVDGLSLLGLLTKGRAPQRTTLYWHYLHKPVFVLTGDLHNGMPVKITDRVWEFASGPHNSGNHASWAEAERPATGPLHVPRKESLHSLVHAFPERFEAATPTCLHCRAGQ